MAGNHLRTSAARHLLPAVIESEIEPPSSASKLVLDQEFPTYFLVRLERAGFWRQDHASHLSRTTLQISFPRKTVLVEKNPFRITESHNRVFHQWDNVTTPRLQRCQSPTSHRRTNRGDPMRTPSHHHPNYPSPHKLSWISFRRNIPDAFGKFDADRWRRAKERGYDVYGASTPPHRHSPTLPAFQPPAVRNRDGSPTP